MWSCMKILHEVLNGSHVLPYYLDDTQKLFADGNKQHPRHYHC